MSCNVKLVSLKGEIEYDEDYSVGNLLTTSCSENKFAKVQEAPQSFES